MKTYDPQIIPLTAADLPDTLVCTPDEFEAADFAERRKLVMAQIDATPNLWKQNHWAIRTECGTAFCVAGWTYALAGGVDQMRLRRLVDADLGTEVIFGTELVASGSRLPVVAARLLGFDPAKASIGVFHMARSYDDVRSVLLNGEEG